MADKSRIHKGDKGILGYNPNLSVKTEPQIKCLYCWFSTHAKNLMTKHIRENHWEEAGAEDFIKSYKNLA